MTQSLPASKCILANLGIHGGITPVGNLRPEGPYCFRATCTAPERRRCAGEDEASGILRNRDFVVYRDVACNPSCRAGL